MPEPAAPRRVTFSGRALGSAIRLTVDGDPNGPDLRTTASAAWDEVVDEMADVDACLSRFRGDSEVTRLNRLAHSGGTFEVTRRLRVALAACRRAGVVTGGRFDAALADVLEGIGERGASLTASSPLDASPLPDRIARERRWRIAVPPLPVDLGGIGKGLALRWAASRVMRRLPPRAGLLLDAGGDLVAAGSPPPGSWLVGVEDPVAADAATADPIAVVALDRGALATSSVRVRRWVGPDGRAVHHLLDPRTREPARTGLLAVTVAAPDPAWAEVWTKALFLAGRGSIAAEARCRGIAAWWVDEEGALGMTPEARVRSAWVAEQRLG